MRKLVKRVGTRFNVPFVLASIALWVLSVVYLGFLFDRELLAGLTALCGLAAAVWWMLYSTRSGGEQ